MEKLTNNSLEKSILIIDDDLYVSEMYARQLRKSGYVVDICYNGNSGLEAMLNKEYRIVLLDIMLPQLSGDDLLNKWRQHKPKGSLPPIVVLTNYEQNDTRRSVLINNSDAYIIKTAITPRELEKIIEKMLTI